MKRFDNKYGKNLEQKNNYKKRVTKKIIIGGIILIAILAIFFGLKFSKVFEKDSLRSSAQAEILEFSVINDSYLNVSIKRIDGDFEIEKIIFEIYDGENYENVTVNYSILPFEKKSFILYLSSLNASTVKNISIIFTPKQEISKPKENNKSKIITTLGGYSESPSESTCTTTCSYGGYECGTQTVCGSTIDCGNCAIGYTCSSGSCNLNNIQGSSPNLSTETMIEIIEWNTTDYGLMVENIETPLTTFENDTYFVWIDSNFRPKIGMIFNGTTYTEFLDKNETDVYNISNDAHLLFSIGVDKNGYIHVTGGMHNHLTTATEVKVDRYKGNTILYWVSDQPKNISQFNFVGNDTSRKIPGEGFTYLYFVTDNNGELYARSRAKTDNSSWHPGSQGWSLWKYNSTNTSWTVRGEIPPNDGYTKLFPAVFWEQGSITNAFYQGFLGDMKFDSNNRLHLATAISAAPYINGTTHILYAYSDDGGQTFYRADGTQIESLPIRAIAGSNQGDIIADNSTRLYETGLKIAFDKNDVPIITLRTRYFNDTTEGLRHWYWNTTTKSWDGPHENLFNSITNIQLITTSDGVLNYMAEDYPTLLYRTSKIGEIGYGQVIAKEIVAGFDTAAARDKGILKFMREENNTLQIVTLNFTSSNNSSQGSSWNNGITSWWTFDENGSDSYGNYDANASYWNVTTHLNSGCKKNGCYEFNESGQGIFMPNLTNPGAPLTISFWFKSNSINIDWATLFYWGIFPGFSIAKSSSTNNIELRVDATALQNQKPGRFSINNFLDGTWHHYIASFNETHVTQSISETFGREVYYTAEYNYTGGLNNSINLTLGRTSSNNFFNGSIDEVIYWNRSLSPAEMEEVYSYFE